MRVPLRLVFRNLLRHPVRSVLTTLSVAVAMFLLCVLQSVVTTLQRAASTAASDRVIVQSAVSLYVDLPRAYRGKIGNVEGVESVCSWQWFGGIYQEPENFFAQFAVDVDTFLDMYPEIVFVDGDRATFERDRRGCIVGTTLAEKYGFRVGDSIPLMGAIFPKTDDSPWEFTVAGVYRSDSANVDENTMYFHYEYFKETLEQGAASGMDGGEIKVGVYVVRVADGADPVQVMSRIDAEFENGPQRVQTTSESEFQTQFVSMLGNVPFFVGAIGVGVLAAILLAVLNTMLMAGREQIHDVGLLKALGFQRGAIFQVMMLQSLLLAGIGGAMGILLAVPAGAAMSTVLGTLVSGFRIDPQVQLLAAGLTVVLGVVAGLLPARSAARLDPVAALRAR